MQYVIVAIFVIVCVWRLKSAITKYNKKSSRTEPTPISDSTKIEFFMQRKKRGMGKEATLADKKCLKEVAKSMGIKFFLYSELIELYNQGMLLKFPEKSPEARAAKKCQREFYL